ncbi:hypothetical protein HMPREF0322_03881 [Desulfitobacterium hafniense DP7]|nr:hypothetical protein HMPREF0322_03881 [Desulfitobacterium hafniense DP7]
MTNTIDNSLPNKLHTASSLPKNYEANSIIWHEDDMLLYHSRDGLYAYQPSKGMTRKLLSEELVEREWLINDWNSGYYGSSPDRSKYILLSSKRKTLEIREINTDNHILSLNSENILEAGWFDNENVFFTTMYSLYIVNIKSGEQVQVTEDSTQIFAEAGKDSTYISWAKNVNKIGDKLYYNGVRSAPDYISSVIYCADRSGEQKQIEKAILLKAVDNQRFIYLKQSKDEYEGTFLYNTLTGESTLIFKGDLRNTGGTFLTNDSKIAFVTPKTDNVPHYGVIFDPVTLQYQRFEIPVQILSNTNKFSCIRNFMGAFKKNGVYIFLFNGEYVSLESNKSGYTNYMYNSKTNSLTEIVGYEGKMGVDMKISPSGEYIAVINYNLFDVIRSDSILNPQT